VKRQVQHKETKGTPWINLLFKENMNAISDQTHYQNNSEDLTGLQMI
jgi:hypothetical protein